MNPLDRVETGLRLPADLHEQLTTAAVERGLPINTVIVMLLRDGLGRLIPVDEWKLTR